MNEQLKSSNCGAHTTLLIFSLIDSYGPSKLLRRADLDQHVELSLEDADVHDREIRSAVVLHCRADGVLEDLMHDVLDVLRNEGNRLNSDGLLCIM